MTNPKQAFGDKKPPLDEAPLIALIELSLALADGAGKYGFRNWRENPVEARTYIKAALRHLLLWSEGEEHARDSGLNNLGAVMACCAILLDAQANESLVDNRSNSQAACDRLHDAEADVARLRELHAARKAEAPPPDPFFLDLPEYVTWAAGQAEPTVEVFGDVYIDRYPEKVRPFAERAYNDGYVDGANSASEGWTEDMVLVPQNVIRSFKGEMYSAEWWDALVRLRGINVDVTENE